MSNTTKKCAVGMAVLTWFVFSAPTSAEGYGILMKALANPYWGAMGDGVEAGAQGLHKVQRGYAPVLTYSAHYMNNDQFNDAVADFTAREAKQVEREMHELLSWLPCKGES